MDYKIAFFILASGALFFLGAIHDTLRAIRKLLAENYNPSPRSSPVGRSPEHRTGSQGSGSQVSSKNGE